MAGLLDDPELQLDSSINLQPNPDANPTEVEVDVTTQTILLHAANHDLDALKPFLRVPGAASVQDPETGWTPLHTAIGACEAVGNADGEDNEVDLEKAKAVVKELFLSGAIWNDLDVKGETPGCLAWRLGQKDLYTLCVEAGIRAEMLLNLMGGLNGGYEELDSGDEDDDEVEEGVEVEGEGQNGKNGEEVLVNGDGKDEERDVNSEDYLKSELKFEDDKLLDADDNGVMMAWETDIMRRSVNALLPPSTPDSTVPATGKRILNIGFGMGIIDSMFAETEPSAHHIIEAHPSVLTKLSKDSEEGGSPFGPAWQSEGGNVLHAGKWQDICPQLLESGQVFDVIYFDTFGEDYAQLKLFFTEMIPGLLSEDGRFGFFNGLGADRRVCYDVYTRVVEMDLLDAGLDIQWEDVEVGTDVLRGEGQGEWVGVRRRYWVLDSYRLPICSFIG